MQKKEHIGLSVAARKTYYKPFVIAYAVPIGLLLATPIRKATLPIGLVVTVFFMLFAALYHIIPFAFEH